VASGDLSRLTGLLRDDAVAMTDGGGRKPAALNPIQGADKVARLFLSLASKAADHDVRIEPAMINGSVGALLYLDGELDHSISISIDGEKIAGVYLVRNPDKLRHAPGSVPH
jgi:RNA polymerase sigma-70 factor, ECF subfamily